MNRFLILLLIINLTGCLSTNRNKSYCATPKDGFVPDERTAIAIAEAVWIPIYGEEVINAEKPFTAKLENGVWIVYGFLSENTPGGVAVAEIAKSNGRILKVTHGA